MYSNRSENSHRWQDGDRGLRQWGEYNKRWERRLEPHSKTPWDSHHNNRGDGHSSTETVSRSREYSYSPKRQSSRDSVNRDWSRMSPVRRRVSSPVWDASEKRSQRYSDDGDRDFRYKHEFMEKKFRLSPDRFSLSHKSKDFKYAPAREDDFKDRRTSPDFRFRQFAQRKQHEDSSDRSLSDCFDDKKGRKRKWERTPERPQSPDDFTKIYVKTRERMDSPATSAYQEDYRKNREIVPVNGLSRQSFESDATPPSASVPGRKLSRGFQRFLNVLNKGVSVDALTKIVSQTSTEVSDECVPQSSFVNAAARSWSPGCAERQQTLQHSSWSGRKGNQRLPSPHPDLWSLSPNRQPASDEELLRRTDGRERLFSSMSKSPSAEKISLTPQDQEKSKQMQDVLQAIGVDLGFEEVGQMSHRIQERLYGKKESERGRKLSRERSTRQAFTSRNQSRSSSSSSSSFSPVTRDCFIKKDSCSPPRDLTDTRETQHSAEYSQMMSSSSFQDNENFKTSSQESAATWNVFPPTSTYTLTQPPPAPLISTHSPISCSPLPNPTLSAAPRPVLPDVGPGFFLPRLPPLLSHTPAPLNFLPSSALAQTRHVLPPPPPLVSPLDIKMVQATNKTQKSKTPSRPRCLHVIK